jgi:hypothetical protein
MSNSESKYRLVTLLPAFASLTIGYAVILEVAMIAGHKLSGGKWPSPVKYWAVAAVALIAGICKARVHKFDKAYIRYSFDQPLSWRQTLVAICFVIGWCVLIVWLMMGPPGEPFKPA